MLTVISSAIRHAITTAVGGYVTQGIVTGDQVEQFTNGVIGIVTVIAVVGWSYVEKKFFKKQ